MASSSIELTKLCKHATLPERNPIGNGGYILRANTFKIIPPLSTSRVSTGISLKFIAEGIIGRLSTSETSLLQSKLMVAVENLRHGHIQVILLNTSATSEASIVPGSIIGELSFHHAVAPLLFWKEDLKKTNTSLTLQEGKRNHPKSLFRGRRNRCDNITNWRSPNTSNTSIVIQPEEQDGDNATSEVWDPPAKQNFQNDEDWDKEENNFPTFKLDVSNHKFGEWKNKPYMQGNQQQQQQQQGRRKRIPLKKRSNLVQVVSGENESLPKYSPEPQVSSRATDSYRANWEPTPVRKSDTSTTWSHRSWGNSLETFTWPPVKKEKEEKNGKSEESDHIIFVDSPTSPDGSQES